MRSGRADAQYQALLNELNEERAAALHRITGTLEQSIDRLRLALEVASSLPDDQRPAALARCRELRDRAKKYRWYLEVQREALGMRRHDLLDEFYPIPSLEA